RPRSSIIGRNTRVHSITPKTFTRTTRSIVDGDRLSIGPPPATPALLTSTSHRPKASSTRSRSSSRSARLVTSQPTTSERPPRDPMCSATPSRRSTRRAARTTVAPRRARRLAVSSPNPDEAPVTTATAPLSSTSHLLEGRGGRRPFPWPRGTSRGVVRDVRGDLVHGEPRYDGWVDVIESHAARFPRIDDRWEPRALDRRELVEGLLRGRIAGPAVSHPMDNVLRNIRLLCDGDPDKQFGLHGVCDAMRPSDVLELVARASGFPADPHTTSGPVPVDPELVLRACEEVGDRLALACRRGERVILATGDPVGLA